MYEEYFSLEDRNYYRDPRVRARDEDRWYVRFSERTMRAVVLVEGEDGAEQERQVRCSYAVCELCNGKGSHVNPSIDCGGLSREDFDDDPKFYGDYMDGMYDVPCYMCNGRRVVPVPVDANDYDLVGERN
jgi:predicted methyltransferase